MHGLRRGLIEGQQPAGRGHHQSPGHGERRTESGEIAGDCRSQVGGQDCSGDPLILPELGGDGGGSDGADPRGCLQGGREVGLRSRFEIGLDASEHDPLKGLAVTTDGFRRIGAALARLGLPTVLVQEGGYLSDILGANLAAVLAGFEAAR